MGKVQSLPPFPACVTIIIHIFTHSKFYINGNVPLSLNTSEAIPPSQARDDGKSHICVNMGLLEPVCLFWHKIPSDWQLRLDIPPAATTHAWLVMKNISLSSWLHTRHTQKYAHMLSKDLWHRSYIRLINLILKVMATWQLFCSSSELDRCRPTVLLMRVSSYLLVFQLLTLHVELSQPSRRIFSLTWWKISPWGWINDTKSLVKMAGFPFFPALMANWKQLRSDSVIIRVGN